MINVAPIGESNQQSQIILDSRSAQDEFAKSTNWAAMAGQLFALGAGQRVSRKVVEFGVWVLNKQGHGLG